MRLLALILLALPAAAAEIDALQPIVGTWVNEEDGGKTKVTSKCAWSPDQKFVICDQGGAVEGKPYSALSIYGYSAVKKHFIFYDVRDGAAPWPAMLAIDGKVWSYLAEQKAAPGEAQYKTTNEFSGSDEYGYKVWRSDDGKKWAVIKSGTSKRAP